MSDELKRLIKSAPERTPEERAAQREGFVFGNVQMENERVTRSLVALAGRSRNATTDESTDD